MNIYKALFSKGEKKQKKDIEKNEKEKEEKREKEKKEEKEKKMQKEKKMEKVEKKVKLPIAEPINMNVNKEYSKGDSELNLDNHLVESKSNNVKQKPISKKYMKYSRSIYHPSFHEENHPYYFYPIQTYPTQTYPIQNDPIQTEPYYHYQTYHSQSYRIPYQTQIPFQTQTHSHSIFVNCPYCNGTVEINETNKMYFRHGIFKSSGISMQPEIKDEICDQIVKSNAIYGCGKKFILLKDYDSNRNITGYSTIKI